MTRHLLTVTTVNLKFLSHYIGVPQYHQMLPSLEGLVATILPTTLKNYYKARTVILIFISYTTYPENSPSSLTCIRKITIIPVIIIIYTCTHKLSSFTVITLKSTTDSLFF